MTIPLCEVPEHFHGNRAHAFRLRIHNIFRKVEGPDGLLVFLALVAFNPEVLTKTSRAQLRVVK